MHAGPAGAKGRCRYGVEQESPEDVVFQLMDVADGALQLLVEAEEEAPVAVDQHLAPPLPTEREFLPGGTGGTRPSRGEGRKPCATPGPLVEIAKTALGLRGSGLLDAVDEDVDAQRSNLRHQRLHHVEVSMHVVAADLEQIEPGHDGLPNPPDLRYGAPSCLEQAEIRSQAYPAGWSVSGQLVHDGKETRVKRGLPTVHEELAPPVWRKQAKNTSNRWKLDPLGPRVEGAEPAGVHAAPVDLELDDLKGKNSTCSDRNAGDVGVRRHETVCNQETGR